MRGVRILAYAVLAVAPTALVTSAAAPAAPAGTSYPRPAVCVDQVGVLDAETSALISRVLRADEEDTTDEIAVVVVRSMGGVSIETWGTGLFNDWASASGTRTTGCCWWLPPTTVGCASLPAVAGSPTALPARSSARPSPRCSGLAGSGTGAGRT